MMNKMIVIMFANDDDENVQSLFTLYVIIGDDLIVNNRYIDCFCIGNFNDDDDELFTISRCRLRRRRFFCLLIV